MPFYEYQCKNCGHALEAMQKVSDSLLKKCPHCGKSQLQRLMSTPVFRLKGSGWYETDFKDDKDKKRNLAEKPEADTPKVTEAKADAKDDAGGASTESGKVKDKPAEKKADKAIDKSSSAAKPKRAGRKVAKRSNDKR